MEHPKYEKTFVLIKPDGIHRSLVGEIIKRIERTGLKISALKMIIPTPELLTKHYGKDDKWFQEKGQRIYDDIKRANGVPDKEPIEYGRDIIERVVSFMASSPVIAFVVEGNQAVGIVKKLVGTTEPLTSDVGTIRGDLTLDSYNMATHDDRAVRNLIHCSDAVDEAKREISLWFKDGEIVKYVHVNEKMLYDVNLDSILE